MADKVSTKKENPRLTTSYEPCISGLKKMMEDLRCSDDEDISPPTIFDIVQFFGLVGHETLIKLQKDVAKEVISNSVWGSRLKDIKCPHSVEMMAQPVTLVMSEIISKECTSPGFDNDVDEEVIPALMSIIAKNMRAPFHEALVNTVPEAKLFTQVGEDVEREEVTHLVGLKVGPTKLPRRIAAKISK